MTFQQSTSQWNASDQMRSDTYSLLHFNKHVFKALHNGMPMARTLFWLWSLKYFLSMSMQQKCHGTAHSKMIHELLPNMEKVIKILHKLITKAQRMQMKAQIRQQSGTRPERGQNEVRNSRMATNKAQKGIHNAIFSIFTSSAARGGARSFKR